MNVTRRGFLAASGLTATAASAQAGVTTVKLSPATQQAFADFVRNREQEIAKRATAGSFLWCAEKPEHLQQARSNTVIQPVNAGAITKAGDGLIHDWIGATFVPDRKLADVLKFLQNYDQHQQYYRPEVQRSRLLEHTGDRFKVYLRLKKTKVLTVVLDTEYDVSYTLLDAHRAQSKSISTKIAELDSAGSSNEHALPPGEDHGFLWKLNTYWRFAEQDGGVYVECEAISLSRAIPWMLSAMVTPIVKGLSEESLARTLTGTRRALAGASPSLQS